MSRRLRKFPASLPDYFGIRREDREHAIRYAHSLLRAEYYASVRALARDVAEAVTSGELADGEAVSDYLHQSVDGCEWVIYTYRNLTVLQYSEHWLEAEENDIGDRADNLTNRLPIYAYYAVRADVEAALDRWFGMQMATPWTGDAVRAKLTEYDQNGGEGWL